MRRPPVLLGAAVLCAVMVGGCAGAPEQDRAVPLMEIVQLRGDVASGHVELRVTNESDAALTVVRATYVSSAWSASMVREDEAEIPAGLRRNLRLALPEPTCADGPLEHRATLELADGTVLEAVPSDPLGQLEALDDAVCDLRAFEASVASVAWLEPSIPADGAGPAVVRLELTPVAGADRGSAGQGSGSLDAVDATVLLTPVDASGSPVTSLPLEAALPAGGGPVVVEVPLEPGRCDLHAIAEDKQGTIFRLRATMAGEAVDLLLPSPPAQREALLDWVVARCAAG